MERKKKWKNVSYPFFTLLTSNFHVKNVHVKEAHVKDAKPDSKTTTKR